MQILRLSCVALLEILGLLCVALLHLLLLRVTGILPGHLSVFLILLLLQLFAIFGLLVHQFLLLLLVLGVQLRVPCVRQGRAFASRQVVRVNIAMRLVGMRFVVMGIWRRL